MTQRLLFKRGKRKAQVQLHSASSKWRVRRAGPGPCKRRFTYHSTRYGAVAAARQWCRR